MIFFKKQCVCVCVCVRACVCAGAREVVFDDERVIASCTIILPHVVAGHSTLRHVQIGPF